MKPHIKIVDSFNRPFRGEGSARKVKGYRVQLIAGNGELLQHSEQLESVKAVKKHIEALGKVFAISASLKVYDYVTIKDETAAQVWPNS
jgi:uncharacterized protein YegP (UPF0339 family)